MPKSPTIGKMKEFLNCNENKVDIEFVPQNLSEAEEIQYKYDICKYRLKNKMEREQYFIKYEEKWHGMLCPAAPGLDKYSLSEYNYSRYLETAMTRIDKQNKEIEKLEKKYGKVDLNTENLNIFEISDTKFRIYKEVEKRI